MGATPKVLVIDDEVSERNLLRMHLEKDGYVVFAAGTGPEGLRLAYEQNPDAIILDIRMPGMDGLEVCGRLRDITDAVILFVTVVSEPAQIVRGLELGADDYVIKPFNYRELSARMLACLRRRDRTRPRRVGAMALGSPWSLDRDHREVVIGPRRVHLTPKEYEVLEFFLEHPDKVFAVDDILKELWGPEYIGDPDLVKQFVYRLRTKLEANPSEPQYFVTVRGSGYAFEPDTRPTTGKVPKPGEQPESASGNVSPAKKGDPIHRPPASGRTASPGALKPSEET